MGLFRCKKHGNSGFQQTCEHVHALFCAGEYEEFHRTKLAVTLLICDGCWKKHDFVRYEDHFDIAAQGVCDVDEKNPTVKAYLKLRDNLAKHIWCNKCIAELKEKAESESKNA